MKCFDYLQELNDLTPYDKRRLHLCLTISNYCFETITFVDYADKTEKCLFKYFTELQQNVFILIKQNHIGQLIQNNPYAKQVLDTAVQTRTEHLTYEITKNEEYLTFIKDDNRPILTEKPIVIVEDHTSHLESSSDVSDESSDKQIKEEQQTKFEQQNSCGATENLKSNSNMLNISHDVTNEEHIEETDGESQQWNGVTDDSKEVSNENTKEESPNIIKDNDETPADFLSDVQDWNDLMTPSKEDEPTSDSNKKSEEIKSSEKDPEQLLTPNALVEEVKQTVTQLMPILTEHQLPVTSHQDDENLRPESAGTSSEESTAEVNENNTEANESEKQAETEHPDERETSTTPCDQPPITVEDTQQQLQQPNNEFKESDKNISSDNIAEQPIIITNKDSLVSISSDEEPKVKDAVENDHPIATINEIDSSTMIQSTQSGISDKPDMQDTTENMSDEDSIVSSTHNEPSNIDSSNNADIIAEEPDGINLSHCLPSNDEKNTATNLDNGVLDTEKNLKGPTIESTIQNAVLEDKTSVPSHSLIVTNKKLEKPTVMKLPQPVLLNDDNNTSTSNKSQPIAANMKEPTQDELSSRENQSNITSHEQSTQPKCVSLQPDLNTIVSKQPRSPSSSSSRGASYSDVVSRQLPTVTNVSNKSTNSTKPQEHPAETQNKSIASQSKIQNSRRYYQTNDRTEKIPPASTIRQSQASPVLVEKLEPTINSSEENHTTSNPSNGERSISSTEANGSKRSQGRKRKAKKSSISAEYSSQVDFNNKQDEDERGNQQEDTQTLSSSQNQDIVSSEEQTNNVESSEEVSSKILEKLSTNDASTKEEPQNSNGPKFRKRKNQPKPRTTVDKKPSSPIIPKPTLQADQAVSNTIFQSISNKKTLGCACVFILICFCFVILIISLAYQ